MDKHAYRVTASSTAIRSWIVSRAVGLLCWPPALNYLLIRPLADIRWEPKAKKRLYRGGDPAMIVPTASTTSHFIHARFWPPIRA